MTSIRSDRYAPTRVVNGNGKQRWQPTIHDGDETRRAYWTRSGAGLPTIIRFLTSRDVGWHPLTRRTERSARRKARNWDRMERGQQWERAE